MPEPISTEPCPCTQPPARACPPCGSTDVLRPPPQRPQAPHTLEPVKMVFLARFSVSGSLSLLT